MKKSLMCRVVNVMPYKRDILLSFVLFVAGIILHFAYIWAITRIDALGDLNWFLPDTSSYLHSARAFIETGVFARGGYPDYHRTIGYPLFLTIALRTADIFRADWLHVVVCAQVLLFALAYPVIYLIARLVFGFREIPAMFVSLPTVALGCFVTYSPFVLADGLFAVFFLISFLLAFLAIRFQSFWIALGYVMSVTLAANIRPMLAFFPLAVLCFQWGYAKNAGLDGNRRVRCLLFVGGMSAMIGVNTPSVRNWYHHGVFTPTRIGSINLFDYLAKDVLYMKGEQNRYEVVDARLNGSDDAPGQVGCRIAIRKHEAFKVYLEYPLETVAILFYNTLLNSVETHWQNMFYLFHKTWYKDYPQGDVLRSPGPFSVAVCFILLYGVIYSLAFLQVFVVFNKPILLIGVFLFLLPYAFCGTAFQGARFRLWLEPFVIIAAIRSLLYIWEHTILRKSDSCQEAASS
jgi:hypothetical protein